MTAHGAATGAPLATDPPRRSRHGHFEVAAPWYDELFGHADHTALLDRLAVAPGMAVLDIGGGTGRVAARLTRLGADVTVLDVSRAMVARAWRRRLPAVVALAEALPIAADRVDRILVVDALHHFADQTWAARELVRVLRPGGRLVIEEPDIRRLAVKGIAVGEKLARMQSHFLAPAEIGLLLAAAGAHVEAVAPAGWSVHVVATKPPSR